MKITGFFFSLHILNNNKFIYGAHSEMITKLWCNCDQQTALSHDIQSSPRARAITLTHTHRTPHTKIKQKFQFKVVDSYFPKPNMVFLEFFRATSEGRERDSKRELLGNHASNRNSSSSHQHSVQTINENRQMKNPSKR